MTGKEFVQLIKQDKDEVMDIYFSDEETEVGLIIERLVEDGASIEDIHSLVNTIMNENCYRMLLAIEGEASLGSVQQSYRLYDEDGNELTGSGEIETEAFDSFME